MFDKFKKGIQNEIGRLNVDSIEIENRLSQSSLMVEIDKLSKQLSNQEKQIKRLDFILKAANELCKSESLIKNRIREWRDVLPNFIVVKKSANDEYKKAKEIAKGNAKAYLDEYSNGALMGYKTIFVDQKEYYQEKVDEAVKIRKGR
jgi:hypothetical protein